MTALAVMNVHRFAVAGVAVIEGHLWLGFAGTPLELVANIVIKKRLILRGQGSAVGLIARIAESRQHGAENRLRSGVSVDGGIHERLDQRLKFAAAALPVCPKRGLGKLSKQRGLEIGPTPWPTTGIAALSPPETRPGGRRLVANLARGLGHPVSRAP